MDFSCELDTGVSRKALATPAGRKTKVKNCMTVIIPGGQKYYETAQTQVLENSRIRGIDVCKIGE